jgi:hemoglobin/transferrin/lactoferrin receptor protein
MNRFAYPLRARRPLLLAVALACTGLARAEAPQLKDVTVTATRTEAAADLVPATVTALTREEMDRRLPADDADLFADEPDVAMPRDLRRHGATRVNIRGIEDNRIVQLVDGVRLPNYYNGGGPTNFTLSATPTAMPDFLKRVEIVRGAASSLYGSDAIGGVIGYVTLDPADLLGADKTHALRYRAVFTGANAGRAQSVLGALRGDAFELLLGYARGDSEAYDNRGDGGGKSAARTRPNPLDARDEGMLAKLVWRPAAGHKLAATVEGREQSADSDIRRLAASLPRVSTMLGDDGNERLRGSLEWEHKPAQAFYDRLTARLYRQDAETVNYNRQTRSNTSASCSAVGAGANTCDIKQTFKLEQDTTGGGVQLESQLRIGDTEHLIAYGADLSRTRVEELREGQVWNLTAGSYSTSLAGETYPLRDFANGRTDTVGLFVQDEISGLAGGRLSFTPGLRYDRTRLVPEMDALAAQVLAAIGRSAVEKSDGAFSPKLGAIWKFDDGLAAYGQIARGFRAPNYEEVNGAFRNTSQMYSVVPNPDLDPETSVGVELGLRYAVPGLRGQVAVYDNRYKDFIESIRLACPGDPRCYAPTAAWRTNIAANLSKVRIYGAEARGAWDFAPGWRLDGGIAYAHGTDKETGEPLDSIEPVRLSLALVREAGDWGVEARLRAAAKKSRVGEYPTESQVESRTWFRTPGYGTVDVSAWYRLSRELRLTASLNNLLDKKYWLWSDIRQADARNPVGAAFYTQPGRNLSLALQADF